MATETNQIPHPPIVTEDEWLAQRLNFLAQEKELTKHKDRVNAARRRLPMVKVDKPYTFDSPDGKVTLLDLFDGKRQLIVHHFMFGPDWEKGCPSCTSHVNQIGKIGGIGNADTRYVIVSQAPLEKLQAYKELKGWTHPWFSSFGTDFNFDYHVSFKGPDDEAQYNYAERALKDFTELPGMSVFFQMDGNVYHTYSTYARGLEMITAAYDFLDLVPYGRQEDFEDSPTGWPQTPTYG